MGAMGHIDNEVKGNVDRDNGVQGVWGTGGTGHMGHGHTGDSRVQGQ